MSNEDDRVPEPEMKAEYDFSQGVRGKYAARFAEGSNVIVSAMSSPPAPWMRVFLPFSTSYSAILLPLT
jgi:hypothetical protein